MFFRRAKTALVKTSHQMEASSEDLKRFARIHILLLQLSGLLTIGHERGCQLVRNLLLIFSHLNQFFLSTMYVLSVAAGQGDAVTIGECVGVVGVHWRYIILYCQRNHLAELLEISCNLWAALSDSEKVIVR